jgi:hypothetical protein
MRKVFITVCIVAIVAAITSVIPSFLKQTHALASTMSAAHTGTAVSNGCGNCHKEEVGEEEWADYSPRGPLGTAHLNMYNNFGKVCTDCHNGSAQPLPPALTDPRTNMKPNHCCSDCHPGGGKPDLFITHMSRYCRCGDCHQVPEKGKRK